jgi:hypothetical protein
MFDIIASCGLEGARQGGEGEDKRKTKVDTHRDTINGEKDKK